jgi:hypothetical protein
MTKTVIAGAIGECVHVAGISNFLSLAESCGWKTIFLGPAVSIPDFIQAIQNALQTIAPSDLLVGVSYRLTPENGERLLGEFAEEAASFHEQGIHFAFGGTPPVAEKARHFSFFETSFDGTESQDQVLAYLKGSSIVQPSILDFPQKVVDRIRWKSPLPLLRHHFGLPTVEDTEQGIKKIAEEGALDILSLGTDQDAQEFFFHPEKQDPRRKGAGGVPARSSDDFRKLYAATRRGNFPLMRAYSGTDDFIRYAELLTETVHNAWCAIPLFWFNRMDGRGPWDLEGSIREHQGIMKWYGDRNIPVELNEPHHWGMRDASDVTFLVAGYLSAYNAKYFKVRDYITQMMFNSPPGTSDAMDLAKMLALLELIQPLASTSTDATRPNSFTIWKQTRTGLLSYPVDPAAARGHLASSIYLQMSLKPHIIHIVGHSEAHHAATADEIIEDSRIARRSITNAMGAPDMTQAPEVIARKQHLIEQASITLDAIRKLSGSGVEDPFVDPPTLAKAVTTGILDAPQLKNNPYAKGQVSTRILHGACETVDKEGNLLPENIRIDQLIRKQE